MRAAQRPTPNLHQSNSERDRTLEGVTIASPSTPEALRAGLPRDTPSPEKNGEEKPTLLERIGDVLVPTWMLDAVAAAAAAFTEFRYAADAVAGDSGPRVVAAKVTGGVEEGIGQADATPSLWLGRGLFGELVGLLLPLDSDGDTGERAGLTLRDLCIAAVRVVRDSGDVTICGLGGGMYGMSSTGYTYVSTKPVTGRADSADARAAAARYCRTTQPP